MKTVFMIIKVNTNKVSQNNVIFILDDAYPKGNTLHCFLMI